MTAPHRQSRCDRIVALIDECLAEHERSTRTHLNRRPNRPEVPPC